jgi:hypothetical protein
MNRPLKQWLFWAPRALGILFAVFVSIFALDVFGENYGFWGTVLALVMHLIPTMIVLTALVIAWRWEAVGGILFIALGAWCLLSPQGPKDPVISGPPFLLGALFLIDWASQVRARRTTT